MTFIITLIYMILGATARRIFGGACENIPVLKNRGVQTVFMCLLFLSIFIDTNCWKDIIVAIILTLWLQFQFWSRGHGACFDIGRGSEPDDVTIERYNERWYHIPCDWLADTFKFKKYSKVYDFCYMTLRYTCPMIPMMLFDWRYILIGLSVAPIYALCWRFYESKYWKLNYKFCNTATNLAELITGGLVYSGIYMLWD